MKIGSWNIRGMNDSLKQCEIKEFFFKQKLDILGIMETRIKVENMSKIVKQFPFFSLIHNYNSHYNGRIWVLWRPSTIQVLKLNEGSQRITLQLTSLNRNFVITFVYGANVDSSRQELWHHISSFNPGPLPWVILGDFNCVRRVKERISDCPPSLSLSDIDNFNACIWNSGLVDLNTIGSLTFGVYDHSPLVITMDPGLSSRLKPFQFLNYWAEDPQFKHIVTQVWHNKIPGIKMYQLTSDLKMLKPEFKKLNASTYSQLADRVAKRAKEHDIQAMDGCTFHFFFSKVAVRRSINTIAKIQNMAGDWCTDTYSIETAFLDYYHHLLRSKGPKQATFVEGRYIFDNTVLTQELVKGYTRCHTSPRCMIKIDIQKAFDSVDWSSLNTMLVALGFPVQFIQWVITCVTTAHYSLKINGNVVGYFPGQKDLRQGDPLSPLLFVLCMKIISRVLRSMNFNKHPKCARTRLTDLLFAADLVIFSRGDLVSVQKIIQGVKLFISWPGLKANAQKSCIYFGGVSQIEQAAIF
ncbi:uncharacterized protein LOC141613520 [Silene latifolia]|uniref:uncharacterized protein LOC141613520 n=1 Tax=Silene latifolia TaxID=37657 RepID=UPI003D7869E8